MTTTEYTVTTAVLAVSLGIHLNSWVAVVSVLLLGGFTVWLAFDE